ncbi:hypothetical protein BKA83DRAFT_4316749 [Pisolithus microcarpus]|nr:hypothetical protein BKA83DRAFT_4316749 [Pisolithus microcarpus]
MQYMRRNRMTTWHKDNCIYCRGKDHALRRGDYHQEMSRSTKLIHFHVKPTFESMERRRRSDDSSILQYLRPSDAETAVRALAVGGAVEGPVALLMDDDVAGVKSEVAGSDKLPTDAEATLGRIRTLAWIPQVRARAVSGCTDHRPFSVNFKEMRRIRNAPRSSPSSSSIAIPFPTYKVSTSHTSSLSRQTTINSPAYLRPSFLPSQMFIHPAPHPRRYDDTL